MFVFFFSSASRHQLAAAQDTALAAACAAVWVSALGGLSRTAGAVVSSE